MTYVLDNDATQAVTRFEMLAQLYDPLTLHGLDTIDVSTGWSCWEVGSGGGSIALELAKRVGPAGYVYATDIDQRWVPAYAPEQLKFITHDATQDQPPATDLDLVHARLVLSHLPEWPTVLDRMIHALRPGGWLLIGELDPMFAYNPDPRTDVDNLVNRVGDAFTRLLGSRGGDPRLGRRLPGELARAGLVNVISQGTIKVSVGPSPATQLMTANITQLAGELTALTGHELQRYCAVLAEPATVLHMPVFWLVAGRRPF